MPDLIDIETGKPVYVPEHKVATALESGLYRSSDPAAKVTVKDERSGEAVEVDAGDLATFQEFGDTTETGDEFREREDSARMERERGGVLGTVRTATESALNSASLGAYDYLGGELAGDDFSTRRKEDKQVHGIADITGEVAGYLTPTGLAKAPGLVGKIARYSPAGAAERLGARIAATGSGKGFIKSAGAKAAGYGIEGGLVGAGETLSEYGLATTELERERAAANLTSNVLFGAAVGGGIGAGSEVAGRAIRKAKKLADEAAEKMAKRGSVSDELASMDKDQLLTAKRERGTAIGRETVEDAKAIAEDQAAWKALSGEDHAILKGARRDLRKQVTNNAKLTSERPSSLLRPLYQEEEVLRKAIASQDTLLKSAAQRETRLIAKLDDKIANFKKPLRFKKADGAIYGDVFGKSVDSKGALLDKAGMEEFRAMLQTGAYRKSQREAMDRLPALLDANMAVQGKVKSVVEKTAPAMREVEDALEALKGGKKKSFIEQAGENAVYGSTVGLMSTVMPFPVAALAASKVSGKISDLVLGRLGKATAKTAKSTSAVVDKFVDAGAKTLERTPPLATKILAGVRFADKPPKLPASLPKARLVRDFKAREAELYSQVTRGPAGLTMRPQARKKLAERLSGVRAASPELADSLETIANRKVSFLAEKLPKKPDFLAHVPGPDDWHPGNEAIRAFARYVAAVEDPAGVEERLADATLTPQDVEAYQAVYPERYAALRNDIAARLPELQQNLPISKRMALSIFTGLPVEPSMKPSIFQRIQSQFTEEPGTEGGTHAPQATPNFSAFGSIKSQDKPTNAQKRAE